jgi:hypothetical protein
MNCRLQKTPGDQAVPHRSPDKTGPG